MKNDAEIREIADHMGKCWQQLARRLKVREFNIEQNERTYGQKKKAACSKMLKDWISQTSVRNKENELNKALQAVADEMQFSSKEV